jgi:hypothetical protein
LPEGTTHPKIYVGLCRADFDLNRNLSRQVNVWCMFLKSGDKYTNKRWRNYYELNEDTGMDEEERPEPPKHGHFVEGAIIGVLLDMDRGMLAFFKDGQDLGQAFVDEQLTQGPLYPFV